MWNVRSTIFHQSDAENDVGFNIHINSEQVEWFTSARTYFEKMEANKLPRNQSHWIGSSSVVSEMG